MQNVIQEEPVLAFNMLKNKKKAFNLKDFKEAAYNWRGHEFREDWRQRERVNSWEGINVGDIFKTKNGFLDIIGIEVSDVTDPASDIYLILEDQNGKRLDPYKLKNYEWDSIEPGNQ